MGPRFTFRIRPGDKEGQVWWEVYDLEERLDMVIERLRPNESADAMLKRAQSWAQELLRYHTPYVVSHLDEVSDRPYDVYGEIDALHDK